MILFKSILLFYVFYGVLLFSAPLKVELSSILPGYVFSLIIVFVIFLGVCLSQVFKIPKSKKIDFVCELQNKNGNSILTAKILGLSAVPLSIYAAYFYTGMLPAEVFIKVFIESISSYNDYQRFFKENNLGQFTLSKLPAIFANFLVKLTMMYLFYLWYFHKEKSKGVVFYICLLLSVLAFLYFSLARGTSFELFEILAYNFFLMLLAAERGIAKLFLSKRFLIYIIFVAVFLFIYSINISLRYSGDYIPVCHSDVFCYDNETILPLGISSLLFKLSGYFGFGFYYLTQFIDSFILDYNLILQSTFSIESYGVGAYTRYLCAETFDCQALWSPSLETWIITIGLLQSLVVIFILSFFVGILIKYFSISRLFSLLLLCYMFFLQAISFPVGDFVNTSSANKMIIIFALSVLFLRYFLKYIKGTAR